MLRHRRAFLVCSAHSCEPCCSSSSSCLLRCYPWFGFVYSEDNVADLPSRLDFVLMRRIGAVERRCVFPTELDWASPARFLTG